MSEDMEKDQKCISCKYWKDSHMVNPCLSCLVQHPRNLNWKPNHEQHKLECLEAFVKFMYINVGNNDDWPIEIKMSDDIADEFIDVCNNAFEVLGLVKKEAQDDE